MKVCVERKNLEETFFPINRPKQDFGSCFFFTIIWKEKKLQDVVLENQCVLLITCKVTGIKMYIFMHFIFQPAMIALDRSRNLFWTCLFSACAHTHIQILSEWKWSRCDPVTSGLSVRLELHTVPDWHVAKKKDTQKERERLDFSRKKLHTTVYKSQEILNFIRKSNDHEHIQCRYWGTVLTQETNFLSFLSQTLLLLQQVHERSMKSFSNPFTCLEKMKNQVHER